MKCSIGKFNDFPIFRKLGKLGENLRKSVNRRIPKKKIHQKLSCQSCRHECHHYGKQSRFWLSGGHSLIGASVCAIVKRWIKLKVWTYLRCLQPDDENRLKIYFVIVLPIYIMWFVYYILFIENHYLRLR